MSKLKNWPVGLVGALHKARGVLPGFSWLPTDTPYPPAVLWNLVPGDIDEAAANEVRIGPIDVSGR